MSMFEAGSTDNELVFPGENWFFYWKTSSALWQKKIESMDCSRIIVPLNWSAHTENGTSYDFGDERTETDLYKLQSIIHAAKKEVIFFLALTPAPFLPNGGIPHVLARVFSTNNEGMTSAFLDQEMKLNKLFSFFDSRIFQAFRKFLNALAGHMNDCSFAANVWGIDCGVIHNDCFQSCMDDTSKCFEQAFNRYLAARKKEGVEKNNEQPLISSTVEEKNLANQFKESIKSLYVESAREFLGHSWEGVVQVAFLGGSQKDLFLRSSGGENLHKYSCDMMSALQIDVIPSSVLLPEQVKNGILKQELFDLVSNSYVSNQLCNSCYDQEESKTFLPLVLFEIFGVGNIWDKQGLYHFMGEYFEQVFKRRHVKTILNKSDQADYVDYSEKINFIQGADVDEDVFKVILKIFMSGGSIIINRSNLSEPMIKRFEMFYLENSLEVEQVKIQVTMHSASLGDGRIVFFEGNELESLSNEKRNEFWKGLISTSSVQHMKVDNEDGIVCAWRTRSVSPNELDYEEVRRLYLYNPTSYKKRSKLTWGGNFALMKITDDNVTVNNNPNQLNLEFLPMGHVWIEFGKYS